MPTARVPESTSLPHPPGQGLSRDAPHLVGAGRGWGTQADLFAGHSDVVVPDHAGTGDLGRPQAFTLSHHAEAMAGGGGKAACPSR